MLSKLLLFVVQESPVIYLLVTQSALIMNEQSDYRFVCFFSGFGI